MGRKRVGRLAGCAIAMNIAAGMVCGAGEAAGWSEAAGGLQGRIVYVGQGGYDGYVVLVGLRNASDKPMAAPMGHPDRPAGAGRFELQAQNGAGVWRPIKGFDARVGRPPREEAKAGPVARLAPGQEALAYLSGRQDPLLRKASHIKVVLRGPEAGEGWHGVLETPPAPANWSRQRVERLAGRYSFPAVFPDLSRFLTTGWSASGNDSDLTLLASSNFQLLQALLLFESGGVRAEFERRFAAERDRHMKLLLASVAAGGGSKPAVAYLQESMKETDYATVISVLSALKRLLYHFDGQEPEWLLAMVQAALCDNRHVSDEYHRRTPISYMANEEEHLSQALGDVNCRQAVPFLIERLRHTGNRNWIMALGDIGDDRAVPVLIDVLKATGKKAELKNGFGVLPAEFGRSVRALAQLKAALAVPTLIEYLWYPEVVKALGWIGDRSVLPALRDLLKAEGRIVRDGKPVYPELAKSRLAAAKVALAMLEEGDAVPRLCALIGENLDPAPILFWFYRSPDPRAIPFLLRAIRTDSGGASANQAITALSAFKYKAVVEGLIGCFDLDFSGKSDWKRAYSPEMYQDNIAQSLRALTGRDIGSDKAQWLQWWRSEGQFAKDLK